MQLRTWAERILLSRSLEEKLARPPGQLDDTEPGPRLFPDLPGRPPELLFAPRRSAPAMPAFGAFALPEKRAIAHHIMANHELQALEVMALVLCGFPTAPAGFRQGLVDVMRDEQRHTQMHVDRAAALAQPFGSLPVNGYIWEKAQQFTSPMDYLAGLPLVFEGANLDHTLEFADAFERGEDLRGAALLRTIHRDEIRHVRFGIEWLRRLKDPTQSDWEAFTSHLHWPLRPAKARGDTFQRSARQAAGLTDEFIDRLEAIEMDDH